MFCYCWFITFCRFYVSTMLLNALLNSPAALSNIHTPAFTLYHLLKMEPTQCSETSAFNTQMPGKYPEDNLSLQQHGESLKTRLFTSCLCYLHSVGFLRDVPPLLVFRFFWVSCQRDRHLLPRLQRCQVVPWRRNILYDRHLEVVCTGICSSRCFCIITRVWRISAVV
jgi:hypothetical protein